MIVTVVEVHVKSENVNAFIEASKENHCNSIKEEGNLRFDVLQAIDDPCRFTLYEAYVSKEASLAHKETEHYKKWRTTVEPFMQCARKGIPHTVITPQDKCLWK